MDESKTDIAPYESRALQQRAEHRLYAPNPTYWTRLWRVFLPTQIWRFIVINLRMLRIIGKSHR